MAIARVLIIYACPSKSATLARFQSSNESGRFLKGLHPLHSPPLLAVMETSHDNVHPPSSETELACMCIQLVEASQLSVNSSDNSKGNNKKLIIFIFFFKEFDFSLSFVCVCVCWSYCHPTPGDVAFLKPSYMYVYVTLNWKLAELFTYGVCALWCATASRDWMISPKVLLAL